MILKRECIATFPTLALIEIREKRLDLMKNRISLWHLKKTELHPIFIGEVTLSVRAEFTLPAHFCKTKQSPTELSLAVAPIFLSFSYFVFACTLLLCIL